VVNNPSGVNSFSGPGGQETPYGAVKRLAQSIKMAPIDKNPALNEPRRSKKRAVSGEAQPEPHPLNQPQAQQAPLDKAEFWSYLASVLPDDQEIQTLASEYTGARQGIPNTYDTT
jgi:hypothetical protein